MPELITVDNGPEFAGRVLDAVTDRMRMLGTRYEALRSQEPMQLPEWAYAKVKAEIAAGNYDYENDSLWNDYTETRQQPEQL